MSWHDERIQNRVSTFPLAIDSPTVNVRYGIYIGTPATTYDKELMNPNGRTEHIPIEETVMSASFEMAMNEVGTCKFKLPPTHPYANQIQPMITEVVVVEIDNVVWFGRVLSIKKDWNNCLDVTCEGALGYLNDSIVGPWRYFNQTPEQRFRHIIADHNAQVPQNRQLSIANVDVDSEYASRTESGEDDYTVGLSAIKSLVNSYGGYLYAIMNQSGLPDIYWITSRNFASAETVEYGKNLLDLKYTEDRSGIFTVLLPLGANVEVERLSYEDDGTAIMEWDENNNAYTNVQAKERVETPLRLDFTKVLGAVDEDGIQEEYYTAPSSISSSAYIQNSTAVLAYGQIVRTVRFVDATTISDLRTKAQTWLNEHPLGGIRIEVDAQDLRFLDANVGRFYLGMTVRLVSAPHNIAGQDLVITRIDADVKKLSKKITLGELPKKTLTDLVGRDNLGYQVGKAPSTRYHKVRNAHELKSNHAEEGIWYIPK